MKSETLTEEEILEMESGIQDHGEDPSHSVDMELDELARLIEEEQERIKEERKTQGKTGRPQKSDLQRELEARQKTLLEGVRYTEPDTEREDYEEPFMKADNFTGETIVDLLDAIQYGILMQLKHPQPDKLPFKPKEKKMISVPLNAYLQEKALELTPAKALSLALAGVMLPRMMPILVKAAEKFINSRKQNNENHHRD